MKLTKAERNTIPVRGRILGIDFGTKRVGISVSDLFQKISSPLQTYHRNGYEADRYFFRQLVEEYEIVGFVVGLPVHMSGDESQKSREAREYGGWLTNTTGLPHSFQDERFSSTRAEAMLLRADLSKKKRQARVDKLAAHILLQAWLDGRTIDSPPQPAAESEPGPADGEESTRESSESGR